VQSVPGQGVRLAGGGARRPGLGADAIRTAPGGQFGGTPLSACTRRAWRHSAPAVGLYFQIDWSVDRSGRLRAEHRRARPHRTREPGARSTALAGKLAASAAQVVSGRDEPAAAIYAAALCL
jgi:hypothetical protein